MNKGVRMSTVMQEYWTRCGELADEARAAVRSGQATARELVLRYNTGDGVYLAFCDPVMPSSDEIVMSNEALQARALRPADRLTATRYLADALERVPFFPVDTTNTGP